MSQTHAEYGVRRSKDLTWEQRKIVRIGRCSGSRGNYICVERAVCRDQCVKRGEGVVGNCVRGYVRIAECE